MKRGIIIDDEINNVELLSLLLAKYCPQIQMEGFATNVKDSIDLINQTKPEIIFLDIMLGQDKGFEVLEKTPFIKAKVIFITGHDEFAIKAFKYSAIDYLLKPIDIQELINSVGKACAEIDKESYTMLGQLKNLSANFLEKNSSLGVIAVPSVDKIDFIAAKDVLYLKSDGRYTILLLADKKKIMSSKNLGEYEEMLDASFFFRIHKSYIVNLKYVSHIDKAAGNYCSLKNGNMLPIAKRRQKLLKEFLKLD